MRGKKLTGREREGEVKVGRDPRVTNPPKSLIKRDERFVIGRKYWTFKIMIIEERKISP